MRDHTEIWTPTESLDIIATMLSLAVIYLLVWAVIKWLKYEEKRSKERLEKMISTEVYRQIRYHITPKINKIKQQIQEIKNKSKCINGDPIYYTEEQLDQIISDLMEEE